MSATSEVWAQEPTLTASDIVIAAGIEHGSVAVKSVDNETRTVTLTVTPSAGYCIQKSGIVVQKLVNPGVAEAPRRAPGIADQLIITDGPAMSKVAAEYKFIVPTDYAGALVTVTFRKLAAATVPVTAKSLVYTGSAQELVTLGTVVGTKFNSGTKLNAEAPLAGYYTKLGDVYTPCSADGKADGTTTYYKPIVTYSNTENGTYTAAIPTGTNVGTYTVYYKYEADDSHTDGSGSVTVTIHPARLTEVKLTQTVKKHTGNSITFTISSVKAGTVNASEAGTDYEVDEVKGDALTQTDIGTYTLKVNGKGNFAGTATASFKIVDNATVITVIDGSTEASAITNLNGTYILAADVSASVFANISSGEFKGTLDGNFHKITGLSSALFNTINGGTVKNVMLDNVVISGGTNVGAICNEATGDTRIYNCGVLATNSTVRTDENGYTHITNCSSSISGSNYVGGIVGLLDGSARVINCFSYANITGGSYVGGIVGYNNVATTSHNLKTMVMNCMYYGNITNATNKAPIYNGVNIVNKDKTGDVTGVGNYNYFYADAPYVLNQDIQTSNCALMAETRFLQRFEFFRHLLNSHRELAAWWATGNRADKDDMAKWVLLPSKIGSSTPYPVLAQPGYYPSVVNIDAENAPLYTERNKGGNMGTLSVTIQMGSGGAQFDKPDGATITKSSLTLNITDKDPEHFNFNYYKVQLPYYNDVGTKNYTGNRVVTGWKIVSITGGTAGTYSAADEWGGYNFADRKCTNKDLYGTNGSNRVFSQGAYWDVPEGVTAITIEPYWAKAAYLADANADKVYNTGMSTGYDVPNVGGGNIYTNNSEYSIAGNNQEVYTSLSNAVNSLSITDSHTVNDYAVVLVGNYHHVVGGSVSDSHPYTVTSVDLDGDDEPDYSFMMRNNSRNVWHPVKWDFINMPGLGMAQKSTGGTGSYNFGIVVPKGWFETTNTSLFRVTQFEYERKGSHNISAPYILQGGVIEQWVTGQQNGNDTPKNITYFHVGGNVWFKEFHRGVHQDKTAYSNHPPVSVTGGDFDKFYLTGMYRADVTSYGDNAECYINGGRFGVVAGAAMEGIGKTNGEDNTGNITWQIQNADIKEFYGGGLNADRPVQGNITTTITGGKIDLFCGGPKFGDMNTGKTVTTTATGCEFGTFFGAGYGGSSYSRRAPRNIVSMTNMPATTGDSNDTERKTYDSWNKWVEDEYKQQTATNFPGISTQYSYQFIPNSNNADNVGRLFVEHVSFSLATTRSVTSTLTDCTITGNFYGGGSLGKVDGPATSTLTDCTVKGNVFGAGYSASLPTVEVDSIGFRTEPLYYTDYGTYRTGVKGATTTYKWAHGDAISVDNTNHILYTTEVLEGLGSVTGNVTLTINGTTTVGGSVYGGGEESAVNGNTIVNVNGGIIGTQQKGGYRWGNVYGGGKGKIVDDGESARLDVKSIGDLDAGLVKGNTYITISNVTADAEYAAAHEGVEEGDVISTPTILHNVYGGGAIGSVGTFTRDANGLPTACAANTGQTIVTINGGTIGHNRKDTGMVDGSSRGWEGNASAEGSFLNQLAWIKSSQVIIGSDSSDSEDKGPSILGSVYGGGENGHNLENTEVIIHKGTIGQDKDWECGNVYGAGCGTDTYTIGEAPTEHHNVMAGIVYGTTSITINGGNILRNVYGGGAMGSVGDDADTSTDNGKTTITINGGHIGTEDNDNYGHVFGGPKGDSDDTEVIASVKKSQVTINANATPANSPVIEGSVFGGGENGIVKGDVAVNITGGSIAKDVYGGGALANTNIDNWDAEHNTWITENYTTTHATTYKTNVTLKGGTIEGNVYGGGLGRMAKAEVAAQEAQGTEGTEGYVPAVQAQPAVTAVEAKVYGDVLVKLNGTKETGEGGTITYPDNCVVKGNIFGCNNINGSPQSAVTVHIYKTQGWDGHAGTASNKLDSSNSADHNYHLAAVYGGGNQAAYYPDLESVRDTAQTHVIIDGCEMTSIKQVYGGGNAASTPATNVTVNGTYEIEEVFGGGNGKDKITINGVLKDNPGANVGFKDYSAVEATYPTKEDRQQSAFTDAYVYGTGKASVNIFGGTVHRVFGGSNTKGNVRQTAVTMLEDASDCEFCVDEAYGGGKSAEMDAEAKLLMACIPGLNAAYGGAEAADVHGNVTLNITNGTFDRVFGGNNKSGTISGSITVNISEVGCKPIIIGELYGGGNLAGYSVYGYNSDKTLRESGTKLYCDPQVNVKSFTSIGTIYGGGYGTGAVMVGSPTVNINEVVGTPETYPTTGDFEETGYKGKTITIDGHNVILPSHTKTKIGVINNVFGGGNAAKVIGDTHVNIGTLDKVYEVAKPAPTASDFASGTYFVLDGEGTPSNPYKYVSAGTMFDADTTYYVEKDVIGVDIRGNVYGGGNNAEVTGNTNVQIGKEVQ